MGRIAGDDPGYAFRICHTVNGIATKPTKHGFTLPSVSTIIGEVLAKPPSAMAWWGFRVGMKGVVEALLEDPTKLVEAETDEQLEALLKERGVSPNMSLESAGDRGSRAHEVLELLAAGKRDEAVNLAADEEQGDGTQYGFSAIRWWDEQIQPRIDDGSILEVLSEVPVWSLEHRYAGTFDLALLWAHWILEGIEAGPAWEVVDAKTHKPAAGFTNEGKGPAYISDVVQIRGYRTAFEELSMGTTRGQRVVVLRDRPYRGVSYLEDTREVDPKFWLLLRAAYDHRMRFEKGDEQ